MAQKLTEDEEALSDVNVIPLADLSLVLLIILMVISPMAAAGLIKVAAAQAQKAQSQQELATPETPVIVSLEPSALKLNGVVVGSDLDFATRLEVTMVNRRDKSVMLTAAPDVIHGRVVQLMNLIQNHGSSNLIMLKWDAANHA